MNSPFKSFICYTKFPKNNFIKIWWDIEHYFILYDPSGPTVLPLGRLHPNHELNNIKVGWSSLFTASVWLTLGRRIGIQINLWRLCFVWYMHKIFHVMGCSPVCTLNVRTSYIHTFPMVGLWYNVDGSTTLSDTSYLMDSLVDVSQTSHNFLYFHWLHFVRQS